MARRALALFALVLVAASHVHAAPAEILLDFQERPLPEIVDEIARATGIQVLYGDDLKGKLTLAAPQRVSPAEAIAILESALLVNGFAFIPMRGGIRKIIPIANWAAEAPLVDPHDLRARDVPIATLITLEQAQAESVVSKISHLVARQDAIISYPPTNGIIFVGSEHRLRRLIEIAQILDVDSETELAIRGIRYRGSTEIAGHLEQIFAKAVEHDRLEITPDERTNRVMLRGSPEFVAAAESVIERIDLPLTTGGSIEVLPMMHRDAEDLAKFLSSMASGGGSRTGGSEKREEEAVAATLVGRHYSAVAETRTNSIIVQADTETRELVRSVLHRLDVKPRQVLLEVTVLDMSKPSNVVLGFDFLVPFFKDGVAGSLFSNPSGGGLGTAENQADRILARVGRTPILTSVIDPATGQTVDVLVPREQAVITASEQRVRSQILSQPNLLTLAGEEAEIVVGNNIPILVSSANSDDLIGALTTTQNVERHDTGITLRVTPNIGEAGAVRLALRVEQSAVAESIAGPPGQVGPTLKQRQVETTIWINPGEIAVVGLLQAQSEEVQVNKIPYFGDIPYLGVFFRRKEVSIRDHQYAVTVQARILDSPSDLLAERMRLVSNFSRHDAQTDPLPTTSEAPYTLRVGTRATASAAESLAAAVERRGFASSVSTWEWNERVHFDVYLGTYPTLYDAMRVAQEAEREGIRVELVVANGVDALNDMGQIRASRLDAVVPAAAAPPS